MGGVAQFDFERHRIADHGSHLRHEVAVGAGGVGLAAGGVSDGATGRSALEALRTVKGRKAI